MKYVLEYSGSFFIDTSITFVLFLVWTYGPVPTFEPNADTLRQPAHWPTDNWRLLHAAQQGINSLKANQMVLFAQNQVVRNQRVQITVYRLTRGDTYRE